MKKSIYTAGLIFIFVLSWHIAGSFNNVSAEWWERPTERPTQPVITRTFEPSPTEVVPTTPQEPTPTSIADPTNTPVPTSTPSGGNGGGNGGGGESSNDDPCGAGKSYTGPHCGWSPKVGGETSQPPRIGAPQVKGLSRTSSGDLMPSDIIFLSGVLCLLLYVRSKNPLKKLS